MRGRSIARLAVAVALVLGTAGQGSAAIVPARVDAAPQDAEALDALLDSPAVTVMGPRSVQVDISDENVVDLLVESASALDGWEVHTTGVNVQESADRRRSDERAFERDVANGLASPVGSAALSCPSVPEGHRQQGMTTPYFGCDTATGNGRWGEPISGELEDSLAAALREVLVELTGSDSGASIVVRDLGGGQMVIDLPTTLSGEFEQIGPGRAMEVDLAMMFTVQSNASVHSMQFTLNGNCATYARLVGGDSCSVVGVPVSEGEF